MIHNNLINKYHIKPIEPIDMIPVFISCMPIEGMNNMYSVMFLQSLPSDLSSRETTKGI